LGFHLFFSSDPPDVTKWLSGLPPETGTNAMHGHPVRTIRLFQKPHGSDIIYRLTVYFPYLLSLPAFAALQPAVSSRNRFMFGFLLPSTVAPLLGLTGDFYELGSLTLFQAWPGQAGNNRLLISDDLFRILSRQFWVIQEQA